jgi:DNA modification methylase
MTPFVEDSDFTLYVGDVREVLRDLPAESVHCVVTSPPYWGLRDYGTGLWEGGNPDCDHAGMPLASDKSGLAGYTSDTVKVRTFTMPQGQKCGKCGARRVDQQLGLEPTPDLYVEAMVEVFREVRRVLRRDGTCWLNLGDSYAANVTGNQPNQQKSDTTKSGIEARMPNAWSGSSQSPVKHPFKQKDLVGIPWMVAFALRADGWYLRSDIIWAKPNPMPESVTDRPTKAHEYLFLLTRSPRYFYDADAIREPAEWAVWGGRNGQKYEDAPSKARISGVSTKAELEAKREGGRNRRSVWEIATEPYPDAHFATFPQALVEPCILAGTSERGCCPECGAPWLREVEYAYAASARKPDRQAYPSPVGDGSDGDQGAARSATHIAGLSKQATTLGWSPSCDHGLEPIPCTVLDCFSGSGTTALVARKHGRRSIGIELNPEYAELAALRLQQLSLLA